VYGTQQQFGQQFGQTAQPQQELVRVLGQTVWNLRELETRIQVLKQECAVLCSTLGIPPHIVGLGITGAGSFGGLGGLGNVGSFGGFGSTGVQGVPGVPGIQGINPMIGGMNPLVGGINPLLGQGITPFANPYSTPGLQGINPLLQQGWYY
jgi:hypothetical protein